MEVGVCWRSKTGDEEAVGEDRNRRSSSEMYDDDSPLKLPERISWQEW